MMLAALLATAFAADVDALRLELERTQEELRLEGEPAPYFTRFTLDEHQSFAVLATLGGVVRRKDYPYRGLAVELRVGSPEMDNTNFGWTWEPNGIDNTSLVQEAGHGLVDRQDAWLLADKAYKGALENLARREASRTRQAGVEMPPSFQEREAETHRAPRGKPVDGDALEALARDLSAVFLDFPEIEWSKAEIAAGPGRRTLIDSAGSEVETTTDEVRVVVTALTRAEDGLVNADRLVWAVRGQDSLPAAEALLAEVRAMAQRLTAWRDASVLEDEYVGPVIFEGEAAVSLFQQLLVTGMGGTPEAEQPVSDISMVFSSDGGSKPLPMKRRVLPPGWSVVDDSASMPQHAAAMVHDMEGTPTTRVQVVEDGVVRQLLMTRTPTRYSGQSTGHARGGPGDLHRALATVVEVAPAKRTSAKRLEKQAHKLAQTYELDHVLVVRRLAERARLDTRGWMAFVGGDDAQLMAPIEVVRRYTDGREEPVRGLVFSGADRRAMRDIVAASGRFSRTYLMSTAGDLPFGDNGSAVHVTAPTVLISEMALVPAEGKREPPTPVPHPLASAD